MKMSLWNIQMCFNNVTVEHTLIFRHNVCKQLPCQSFVLQIIVTTLINEALKLPRR
jgi:hypothetical protein